MRREPRAVLAVAAGGALGAPVRYSIGRLVEVAPGGFPWATFGVNVTGSFALGVVVTLLAVRFPASRYLRPLVATGFLGAYTTYSTFAVETVVLAKDGHAGVAVAYVAASLAGGLLAAWTGIVSAARVQS